MPLPEPAVGTPYRNYAIETNLFRLDLQETILPGRPQIPARVGVAVTFAVADDMVYIRQGKNERVLRLIKRTNKLKTYAAAGSGHYITSVDDGGLTVTLEDGSVWELDPKRQDRTAHWQALAGIYVSYDEEQEDNGYNYFLNNTDEDEGALARLKAAGRN